MITFAIMGLFVIVLAITTLWGVKYDATKNSFLSMEDTLYLRGFWCIIVILVHVPPLYQNRIQDALGSFAYIGVTFFFMTSAYGLKSSIDHKPRYMNHFWKKRIPGILIPALIANSLGVIVSGMMGNEINILSFLNINNWVKVLLLYYAVFWLIYYIVPKIVNRRGGYWQDILICLIVITFSLFDYFTSLKITSIWIVEPLGFAYGILSAVFEDNIRSFTNKNWIPKVICFALISVTLGISYLRYKTVLFFGDYLLKILLGLSITVFMYEIISKLKVGNKVNAFLGGISYEVYLLHGVIFVVLAGIKIGWNSGVYIVVAIFITLLVAWLSKQLCNPLIKAIR